MKVVITPDSCKESLSATEVVQAVEKGLREIFPGTQYISIPVADGGEGTVEAMITTTQGSKYSAQVTGPLGEKADAYWGMSGDDKTTSIKIATASGLALVPPEKYDPLVTTSRDTGELILQTLGSDAQSTIIGIGGSTTDDGSAGMVQTLGAKLCDTNGTEIGYSGGDLMSPSSIDISGLGPRLETCFIRVAYDVTNPFIGDSGASCILGPQEGAMEERILGLDRNLSHYADVIRKSLRVDVKDVPGFGAAGGMDATLMAFLGAELRNGVRIVTQALNLEEHIHDYMLMVTGEGRINSQSVHDKVPVDVTNVTKKYHKPVIGVGSSLTCDVGVMHQYGIDAVLGILTSIGTLEKAFRGAFDNIYRASRDVATTLAVGMRSTG